MEKRNNLQQLKEFDRRSIPGIIVFLVLFLVGFSMFFYWRSKRQKQFEEEKVTVAVSILPIYDFIENIVGENDYIEIIQMIPSDSDPLQFDAADDLKSSIQDVDLIFKIGPGFDDWIEETIGDNDVKVVDLSKSVELKSLRGVSDSINYQKVCEDDGGEWLEEYNECTGVEKDFCIRNEGEYYDCASACRHDENADACIQVCIEVCSFPNKGNFLEEKESETTWDVRDDMYYWLSIENSKKILKTITEEIIILQPEFSDGLYQNYLSYVQELDVLKKEMEGKVEEYEVKSVYTFSDKFNYFSDEYKFNVVRIADLYEGEEVSNVYLEELKVKIDEKGIGYIYREPGMNLDAIDDWLWDQGVEIRVLDPYGGSKKTSTYKKLIRFNVDSISGKDYYE